MTGQYRFDTLSDMSIHQPRTFRTQVWIFLIIIASVLSFIAGSSRGSSANTGKNDAFTLRGIESRPPVEVKTSVDFQQFWDVWKLLKTQYYEQPLDERKLFYGALEGLVGSTGDPYTVFFEPKLAEEFSQSLEGRFEGIGAEIGIKNDQLQVVAPLPESPAVKAGLMAGDLILAIDVTSTEGMTVERAVSLIRGKKGTSVTLNIGRVKTKKQFDVSIVRDTIVVKSVRVRPSPKKGIEVIEITNFNSDTSAEFIKAVDQALANDVKGLIIDLRNNPGGFLDKATAVSGEWVGNQIVVKERRQGVIVDEFHGTGRGKLKEIPTVILVNEGSASASEIVAGALRDYGMATLIGKKTYGKGSVQDYTELENGSAIKITVAEWLTPKGNSINNVGIEPDIEVDRTEEDYHAERDPQLEKAVEFLTGPASNK